MPAKWILITLFATSTTANALDICTRHSDLAQGEWPNFFSYQINKSELKIIAAALPEWVGIRFQRSGTEYRNAEGLALQFKGDQYVLINQDAPVSRGTCKNSRP